MCATSYLKQLVNSVQKLYLAMNKAQVAWIKIRGDAAIFGTILRKQRRIMCH